MVSPLIDLVSRWWKIQAIRTLFLPFEADTILKIPLNHNLPKNKLIWIGNRRLNSYLKSAYFVTTKFLDTKDEGECSTGNPNAWVLEKNLVVKAPCKNQDLLLVSLRKWPPYAYKYGCEGYANFLRLPNLRKGY